MTMIEQSPNVERHDYGRSEGALAGAVFNTLAFEDIAKIQSDELDHPEVIYRHGKKDAPYRILFFPGSCTNMEETAEHFTHLYGEYGSLYMVKYQNNGFDHNALKPAIVKELDSHESADANKQTVILTQSLGGPISNVLRRDSLYRDRIGTVSMDVEDSPLVHPSDLRPAARLAAIVAARLPGNELVETVNSKIMNWAVRNGLPHSELVSDSEAEWHGRSTAMTPFKARKGQTKFINKVLRSALFPGALYDGRESVREKYVVSSEYDSVLDPQKASERLARLWGIHVMRIIEEERSIKDPGNHGGIFEFPQAIRNVLEGKYSEAYQQGVKEVRVRSVVAEAEAVLEAHNTLLINHR